MPPPGKFPPARQGFASAWESRRRRANVVAAETAEIGATCRQPSSISLAPIPSAHATRWAQRAVSASLEDLRQAARGLAGAGAGVGANEGWI